MIVEGEYYDGPCKLLELPHYVLGILFSYLDATSLYQISRTCSYLKEFVLDPLFWKQIDARDDPNICDKIEYCTCRVHEKTTHFCVKGNLNFTDIPVNFFSTIKPFENIKVLVLERTKLKGSKVTLRDFPPGLEELSLRRTYVKQSDYFFQHSVKNMPKLRVLILDECSWVTCSFLLSISKYEQLEIISIVRCLRVHMNMIPYLNVAKLGCKKLKIFDCRFTGIGGELLRTFYSKENLQRLYFQSFKSAEVDYHDKNLDYSQSGRKKRSLEPNTDMSIEDIHLGEYRTVTAKPKNETEHIHDSYLYRDPYPECTCGGEGSREPGLSINLTFPEEDRVYIPSRKADIKFVCSKHIKDILNLPKSFKDFFLSKHQQYTSGVKSSTGSVSSSGVHSDSDSNLDDEDEEDEGSCCYFGMGTSLIMPITHDRTPSAGEEMTLPGEGARNQSFRRVLLLRTNRPNDAENTEDSPSNLPNTSRSQTSASSSTKRSYENSDGDNDSDLGQSKKSKKSTAAFDELSNQTQEALINQLVHSVDDVSSRIDSMMEAHGLTTRHSRRRHSSMDCEPSTSRESNGLSSNSSDTNPNMLSSSTSSAASSVNNMPSCSKTKNPDRDKNGNGGPHGSRETTGSSEATNSRSNFITGNGNLRWTRYNPELNENRPTRRVTVYPLIVEPNAPNRWKGKWKIPLRRLSLRGYRKITDVTLGYLSNLDIELIDLTYTSVTKIGIEHFLVHNPNCRVIHPLYCICKPTNSLF